MEPIKNEFDLSIVIPARNEMFLSRTIQDIMENKRGNTEVIAVLDGEWARPAIEQQPDVNVIHVSEAIGQRATTNLGVKMARGKYIMKLDAHCAFDKGFDVKMLDGFKEVGDDVTMVPIMRNLHAFDYKCHHCGWSMYQGPKPKKCPDCGKSDKLRKKMRWIGKHNPQSTAYCFDSSPHFQYFEAYKHREPYLTDIKTGFTETMSLQGSCFMATREKHWELGLSDEKLGSWGNQGIEVALKTWLSGGRVLVNHRTWYAHMFRTQGGDFSFPYPQSGKHVSRTKKRVKNLFWEGEFKHQIHPVSWIVEKFWPIKGWDEEDLKKLNG